MNGDGVFQYAYGEGLEDPLVFRDGEGLLVDEDDAEGPLVGVVLVVDDDKVFWF